MPSETTVTKSALGLGVALLAMAVLACDSGADAPPAVEAAPPEVSMVLDGTSIVDVADFALGTSSVDRLAGRYRSDQGGAEVIITVTSQPSGDWVVERVYAEPAAAPLTATYTVRRTPLGLADEKGSMYLQATREGVLALEHASGVDSIPASYWIHYVRDQRGSAAQDGEH